MKIMEVTLFVILNNAKIERKKHKVLPRGIEPLFRDSKSHVLTITLRERNNK